MSTVIVSKNKPKMRAVYHKQGCIYERRIAASNKMYISEERAEYYGYCECKYCNGLKGEIRTNERFYYLLNKYKISEEYNKYNDTLYLRTQIAAWKIYLNETSGKYVLHHKNKYNRDMNMNQIIRGEYHKQKDIKPMEDICNLITYIGEHDKAKLIIMDDYRKLPKQTNKQRKYYRQAEKREKRQSKSRTEYLFRKLEAENPNLKKMSIC